MGAALTILTTSIRQDAEGRYCLNDCHKASGTAKKDGPSYWLTTDNAKKLTSQLDSETTGKSVVTIEGRNGGTYVAKELVYAYAMWISADFSLTVIRAFDTMVTKGPLNEQTLTKEQKIAEAFLLLHADHEELKAENAVLAPQAAGFRRIADTTGLTNLREVGKVLGIGSKHGIELCRSQRLIFRSPSNGKWNGYSEKIDSGLIDVKYVTYRNSVGEEVSTQQVFVTPKGMTRLATHLGQN